jgi:hypothetical protein
MARRGVAETGGGGADARDEPSGRAPLRRAGDLPATRFGGFVRISQSDVEAYIAAHRIEPGTIGYLFEQ